jgi:hypothetical protein
VVDLATRLAKRNEHYDLHEKAPRVKSSCRASPDFVDQVTLPFALFKAISWPVQVGFRPSKMLQSKCRPRPGLVIVRSHLQDGTVGQTNPEGSRSLKYEVASFPFVCVRGLL